MKGAILVVLAVWAVGAALLPLHGVIHVLLVLVIILLIIDRAGR